MRIYKRTDFNILFWSKVDKKSDNECWEWIGAKDKNGYGIIMATRYGFNTNRAHRLSYLFAYGEFDTSLLVCHTCDNPSCINPKHLFIGTVQDNIKDKLNKGRASGGSLLGELSPAHKLTEETVKTIRSWRNSCSLNELAVVFGVSKRTILDVVQRRTWKGI